MTLTSGALQPPTVPPVRVLLLVLMLLMLVVVPAVAVVAVVEVAAAAAVLVQPPVLPLPLLGLAMVAAVMVALAAAWLRCCGCHSCSWMTVTQCMWACCRQCTGHSRVRASCLAQSFVVLHPRPMHCGTG